VPEQQQVIRRNLTVSKPNVNNEQENTFTQTHINKMITLELNLSNKHLEHVRELFDDIICYEDWYHGSDVLSEDEEEENEYQKYAVEEFCIAISKHLKNT